MPVTSKIKVGDSVWLRDNTKGTKEPFVTASVINSQQGGKRITAKNSKTNEEVICDLSSADIFPANPTDQTAPDHCALIHLNEPCILENSRKRYMTKEIYTYTGKILVALNPFDPRPHCDLAEVERDERTRRAESRRCAELGGSGLGP